MKKWSRRFENCIRCNTTEYRHTKDGLCMRCYLKDYREDSKNIDKIKEAKSKWYRKIDRRQEKKEDREQKWFDGKREEALVRDKYKCTKCGSTEQLTVHHIDGNGRGSKNPNNSISNLETLCRACHASVHTKLDRWAKDHDECISCGTTEIKHNAKGLCRNCYAKSCYTR